ncbi:ribosome silencing factor [Atribacter laminatus]|jgi:ribosome-associated protein|uniref:Ribosomal silencing factor RsfS n=1 Tax=Atribacter laminatus TaxID=2847778 RepID=A0A7T1AP53_ATRLM|nr:ribosome silencing factor [Atribacter laminatus]QPM69486.1 Ribosomal silencing factor RsfS [Atribacter laminatus]
MNPKEKCLIVLEVADEKKMQDVVVLDLRNVFPVADYWIIGSAATFIQTKAIAEEIKKTLDSYSVQPFHIEGFDAGEWILMDYGDVIVHIFREEERQYYQLEKLWRNALLVYSKELQVNKFNEID